MSSLTLEGACERYMSVLTNSVWDKLLDKCLGRGLADRLHITRLEKAHELSARVWEDAMAEMSSSTPSINDDLQSSNVPTRRSNSTICTSVEDEWDMFFKELEENGSLNDRLSDDEEEEEDRDGDGEVEDARSCPSYPMAGIGRYHHAKDAPKEWAEQLILQNLSFIAPFAKSNVDKVAGYPGWHSLFSTPGNDRLFEKKPERCSGFIMSKAVGIHAKGFSNSNSVKSTLRYAVDIYKATGVVVRLSPTLIENEDPCVAGPVDSPIQKLPVIFVGDGDECAVESCDSFSLVERTYRQDEVRDNGWKRSTDLVTKGKEKPTGISQHSGDDDVPPSFFLAHEKNGRDLIPIGQRSIYTIIKQHKPIKFDRDKAIRLRPWKVHWKIRRYFEASEEKQEDTPGDKIVAAKYAAVRRREEYLEWMRRIDFCSRPRHGCGTDREFAKKPTATHLSEVKDAPDTSGDTEPLLLTCYPTNPFDQLTRRVGLRPASTALFPVFKPLLPHTTLPETMEETREKISRGLTALRSFMDGKNSTPPISTFCIQAKKREIRHVKMYQKEVLGLSALTGCHPHLTSGDWAGYYKKRDEEDMLRSQGLLVKEEVDEKEEKEVEVIENSDDEDDKNCDFLQLQQKKLERQKKNTWPQPPMYADYVDMKMDQPFIPLLPEPLELLDYIDPVMPTTLDAERGRTMQSIRIQDAEEALDMEHYAAVAAGELLAEMYKVPIEGLKYWSFREVFTFAEDKEA
ncbi:hypothetical protein EMCG_03543 [[Emmonsia] crescens]|uniref:Uncharacterized protein n=1 Tax=[Emmonsia] crescens TaxID=73230 RepID=A0A0G2J8C4_9EURO|nr:hypothetical protein EMCG_03543 [Emmonsia crescens UAMH 3008]